MDIIEASVTVGGVDYLARGDSERIHICRREGSRWVVVGFGRLVLGGIECDAPLGDDVYDALEERIGGERVTTYRITGEHVARLAARDGLTIRTDGDLLVTPTGWTGPADGYHVLDFFRGHLEGHALSGATYLGPDADGIEPTWRDASEIVEASVTVNGEDYLARGESDHVSICRREGGRWVVVGFGRWDGMLICDAPLDSAVYDALEARIGGDR